MNNWLFTFFNYFMIFYSSGLILSYLLMTIVSLIQIRRRKKYNSAEYIKRILLNSPHTPGISIIAPAYNEETTVVDNVNSLLGMDYPKFEVIIVNDGSKDNTLEKLIKNFDLIEVPYNYIEYVKTKPYKRLFKSTNEKYKRLVVVDKENGGTKADASNAGINVAQYPYFVCTDVDCILNPQGLYYLIWDVLSSEKRVIAVSATMRMANSCTMKDGRLAKIHPPISPLPLFQELEYIRSFLIGKTWWAAIGGMPNVSGGFGLFDTEIAIRVGGYHGQSMAEDMDMIARMTSYMYHTETPYKVTQVPQTVCWTEGPSTLTIFNRQRTRWGRGLFQFFHLYWDIVFNRQYGIYGTVTLPYLFIFEFLGPIIEFIGFIVLLFLMISGAINWTTFWLLLITVYIFMQFINTMSICFDNYTESTYSKRRWYAWLIIPSVLEAFIYHPITVIFALKGYISYLTTGDFKWGEMKRKGFKKEEEKEFAQKDEQIGNSINNEYFSNQNKVNSDPQQHNK
ncbi:MAG: glycosyltransferase family 2 protein [Bacteroidaceae bacterium]|nr:glycosyltransferase family 2 protein [Bacteroidaceae bacterium]